MSGDRWDLGPWWQFLLLGALIVAVLIAGRVLDAAS